MIYSENCNRLKKLEEIYEQQIQILKTIIKHERIEEQKKQLKDKQTSIFIGCLFDKNKYNEYELEEFEYQENIKNDIKNLY